MCTMPACWHSPSIETVVRHTFVCTGCESCLDALLAACRPDPPTRKTAPFVATSTTTIGCLRPNVLIPRPRDGVATEVVRACGRTKAYSPCPRAPLFSLQKPSTVSATTQRPTMTAGLRFLAAAAFVAATSTVVQHANAATSSDCDALSEGPRCSESFAECSDYNLYLF